MVPDARGDDRPWQVLVPDKPGGEPPRDERGAAVRRAAHGLDDDMLRLRWCSTGDLLRSVARSRLRVCLQLVQAPAERAMTASRSVRNGSAPVAHAARDAKRAEREHGSERPKQRRFTAHEVARVHILAEAGPQLAQVDVQARPEVG